MDKVQQSFQEYNAQREERRQNTLFSPKNRVRLTGVGGVALFGFSWMWSNAAMLQWSLPLGAVISTLGILMRMWATGWLRKDEVLTIQGPYQLTRNPLYLGTLILALGHSLMSGVALAPIIFPLMCFLLYLPTMREEEAYLETVHGAAYTSYRREVPIIFPALSRLKRVKGTAVAGHEFSWAGVRRCYKGFIANALVIGIFALIAHLR